MLKPFEDELQRNAVLRCLYENSKVNAILVSDTNGYILHLNEAFIHFYGHTVDVLRNKNVCILFTEEDQKNKLPELEIEGVSQFMLSVSVYLSLLFSFCHRRSNLTAMMGIMKKSD